MEKKYIIYAYITPDGKAYIGITGNRKERYKPGKYKGTALWPYIEKYGWNSLEHIVSDFTMTKGQALKFEDDAILELRAAGRCINRKRSGGDGYERWVKEKSSDYNRQYAVENRDRLLEYQREYRKRNLERCWELARERKKAATS